MHLKRKNIEEPPSAYLTTPSTAVYRNFTSPKTALSVTPQRPGQTTPSFMPNQSDGFESFSRRNQSFSYKSKRYLSPNTMTVFMADSERQKLPPPLLPANFQHSEIGRETPGMLKAEREGMMKPNLPFTQLFQEQEKIRFTQVFERLVTENQNQRTRPTISHILSPSRKVNDSPINLSHFIHKLKAIDTTELQNNFSPQQKSKTIEHRFPPNVQQNLNVSFHTLQTARDKNVSNSTFKPHINSQVLQNQRSRAKVSNRLSPQNLFIGQNDSQKMQLMARYAEKLDELIGIPQNLTNNPTFQNLIAISQKLDAQKLSNVRKLHQTSDFVASCVAPKKTSTSKNKNDLNLDTILKDDNEKFLQRLTVRQKASTALKEQIRVEYMAKAFETQARTKLNKALELEPDVIVDLDLAQEALNKEVAALNLLNAVRQEAPVKENPFAALKALKQFKQINVNTINFKADPKRILADFVKDLSSFCNQREAKQLEDALAVPKELDLKGVALTSHQMLALKKGFEKLNQIVSSVNIEENDIDDCELAKLISFFESIPQIKTVNIRKMKNFGEESLKSVLKLVQKQQPQNIDDIAIENCEMEPSTVKQFLTGLLEKSALKKLSLSGLTIHEDSFELLTRYLNTARLTTLKLSGINLQYFQYLQLLETLLVQKDLQYIDLSRNMLIRAIRTKLTIQFSNQVEQDVAGTICQIIKRNRKIQHLNLSHCMLTNAALLSVLLAIYKSRSLQAVHLCENPGLLDSRVQEKVIALFGEHPKSILQINEEFVTQKGVNRKARIAQLDEEDYKLKVNKGRNTPNREMIEELPTFGMLGLNRMVIQRVLSHPKDLPGHHKWSFMTDEHTSCWMCDKWAYTIVFWSRPFGKTYKESELGAQEMQTRNQLEAAMKIFNGDVPLITTSAQGWPRPQRMLPINEFVDAIDKAKPEYIQKLKKQGQIYAQQEKYVLFKKEYRDIFKEHKAEYVKSTYSFYGWVPFLKERLCYKQPCLVNQKESMIFSGGQIYATGMMLRPNRKHQIMIMDPRTNDKFSTYQHFEPSPRLEPVPPFNRVKKTGVQKGFDKEKSIFSSWPTEGMLTFTLGMMNDIQFSKLPKFIKDNSDLDKCKTLLMSNAKDLFLLFCYISSRSIYPSVSQLDLIQFFYDSRVIDLRLKMTAYEVSLRSTLAPLAVDEVKLEYPTTGIWQFLTKEEKLRLSSDQNIQRFQFIELLVRLAGQKYRISHTNEMGIYTTYNESLARLLDEIFKTNAQADFSAEYFRFSQLWQNDVDIYFTVNESVITKLFNVLHNGKKYVNIEDLQQFMQRVDLGLTVRDFTQLYGLSKQVVFKENENAIQYLRLKMIEFIEFIARYADFKFTSTVYESDKLVKKIAIAMDGLLGAVGLQQCVLDGEDLESTGESESDY